MILAKTRSPSRTVACCSRRVNRRRGDGVPGRPASPVPADIAFVLSHHVPPPAAGVNYPPEPAFAFQSDGRLFRHKPLER